MPPRKETHSIPWIWLHRPWLPCPRKISSRNEGSAYPVTSYLKLKNSEQPTLLLPIISACREESERKGSSLLSRNYALPHFILNEVRIFSSLEKIKNIGTIISMSKMRRAELSHPQSLSSQLAGGRVRMLMPWPHTAVPKSLWWHVRNICKEKHPHIILGSHHPSLCRLWFLDLLISNPYLLTHSAFGGLFLADPVNGDLVYT